MGASLPQHRTEPQARPGGPLCQAVRGTREVRAGELAGGGRGPVCGGDGLHSHSRTCSHCAKEKGKQGKYKAFHTPRTRETSRVRETLKGEVGITRPFHLPSFSIFLRTKGENLILMCIHFPFKFWQGQIPEKKKKTF